LPNNSSSKQPKEVAIKSQKVGSRLSNDKKLIDSENKVLDQSIKQDKSFVEETTPRMTSTTNMVKFKFYILLISIHSNHQSYLRTTHHLPLSRLHCYNRKLSSWRPNCKKLIKSKEYLFLFTILPIDLNSKSQSMSKF
jgi:hypothetical protein